MGHDLQTNPAPARLGRRNTRAVILDQKSDAARSGRKRHDHLCRLRVAKGVAKSLLGNAVELRRRLR